MDNSIDLKSEELKIVIEILKKHLRSPAKVWLFGSRATHTAKKFSDIDLLINIGYPLPLKLRSELAYDFEESDLSYKVDLLDQNTIDHTFRNIVDKEKILIYSV